MSHQLVVVIFPRIQRQRVNPDPTVESLMTAVGRLASATPGGQFGRVLAVDEVSFLCLELAACTSFQWQADREW